MLRRPLDFEIFFKIIGLFNGASLINFEHIQPANLAFSWLTLNKYSLVRIFDFQKKTAGKTQLK